MTRRKDGHVSGEDEDILDLGAPISKREVPMVSSTSFSRASPEKLDVMDVDSGTDASEEDILATVKKRIPQPVQSPSKIVPQKSYTPVHLPDIALPTPARSPSSVSPPTDPGLVTGRIIGNSSPLKDFKENIMKGDFVSQAVRDLGLVIKEIVTKPFSSRRHEEMLACLKAMREVALQVCDLE